ncbi:MAG: hypothetical protein JNJ77_04470 [Planctomycetia bacterium]|nr:hypothetical protein [Planctomycetia bacterium]
MSGSQIPSDHQITAILQAVHGGNTHAAEELLAITYHDVRRIANMILRSERPGHTFPTVTLNWVIFLFLADQI